MRPHQGSLTFFSGPSKHVGSKAGHRAFAGPVRLPCLLLGASSWLRVREPRAINALRALPCVLATSAYGKIASDPCLHSAPRSATCALVHAQLNEVLAGLPPHVKRASTPAAAAEFKAALAPLEGEQLLPHTGCAAHRSLEALRLEDPAAMSGCWNSGCAAAQAYAGARLLSVSHVLLLLGWVPACPSRPTWQASGMVCSVRFGIYMHPGALFMRSASVLCSALSVLSYNLC